MTLPELDPLDPRLNVFSNKSADKGPNDGLTAQGSVEGEAAQIGVPVADLFRTSDIISSIEAQLLYGHTVKVFDRSSDRVWVQADHNGYVGWISSKAVAPEIVPPTHRVIVPRTYLYPEPDMKLKTNGQFSIGSLVNIAETASNRGTEYAVLSSGEALILSHIAPLEVHKKDFVAVAETLLHVPYLWGGDSGFGLDCSGLLHLSMTMTGRQSLRDSDMQAATLGDVIDPGDDFSKLKRGDLIFWKGHVAIVRGDGTIIHANGHTMSVAIEPLEAAIDRIAYLYEKPIGCRRP